MLGSAVDERVTSMKSPGDFIDLKPQASLLRGSSKKYLMLARYVR
jgi:hypothetical protein